MHGGPRCRGRLRSGPPGITRPLIVKRDRFPLNSTKEDSMRRFVAASALVFAFATSAEARTQHHHYRHYAHYHYGHYAHRHYRQQAEGFRDSGFGSGFGAGLGDSSYERSNYGRRSTYERSSYRH